VVGADWPIHDLAERYLYSVHMAQHLLFTLVAAPLLVAGTPAWLWRDLLRRRIAPAGVALRDAPAAGDRAFQRHPAVLPLARRRDRLGPFRAHALRAAHDPAGVRDRDVVARRLAAPGDATADAPGQMLYLFIQSLAPTIPASFLTFGHVPLYPVYGTFPRIWGMSVMTDQMIAGLTMKIVGGAILWTVITVVFFRWARRDQTEGWDALQWRDVDAEIRAEMGR
jgi:putative membrane protein